MKVFCSYGIVIAVVLTLISLVQRNVGTTTEITDGQSYVKVAVSDAPISAGNKSPQPDGRFNNPAIHGITRSYGHGGKQSVDFL